MEQLEPTPVANGHGTIKFLHLLLHPGFVMSLPWPWVIVSLMSDVVAGIDNINSMVTKP